MLEIRRLEMVRKRERRPRSIVKIVRVHPKHSKLISMVPIFVELANILESIYFVITVYLHCYFAHI